MQNKGAIRLFAIVLALVCAYQLSFTFVASGVRSDAEEYADGDLKKELYYLDSLAGEGVFNIGIKDFTFREVQENEINLGLDLKGGMNVILEISVSDILVSLSNYNTDTTFRKAIELANEAQKHSQEDYIDLFYNEFTTIDQGAQLAAIFATRDLSEKIDFNSDNQTVLKVLRTESKSAIDNAFNILSSRIDRFGVAQPKIQSLETAGRILIELPGIKDNERARNLLESSANLEFWETYESSEVLPFLGDANMVIKEYLAVQEDLKEDAVETSDVTEGDATVDAAAADQDGPALLQQIESETSEETDSVDAASAFSDYPLYRVLTPYVTQDSRPIPGSKIGIAAKRDMEKVDEYLAICREKNVFPRNLRFLWAVKAEKGTEDFYGLYAIKVTTRDGRAPLDGDVITTASVDFGTNQATAGVSMNMDAEGTSKWARITAANIDRCIAIVLDDYVYSAPRVQNEISGGSSQITGDFTVEEAEDLSNILKSGKLPAPARIIQEEIVGPSLGHEAISSGMSSFMIAFIVILAYMVFYYSRRAGLVADIALVANMFFLIGVLASLGATLTLPGIAGIVLTIGMSVDANVLIYERIREELKAGKGLKLAITDGYKNAYSAILDANITTGLTALILYLIGTGPIKGFATTLLIGIFTSLFSAIFITRLVFMGMMNRENTVTFDTKVSRNAFQNTKINFIGKRKIFYVISGIVIALGLFSLFTRGLNTGVDFTGGRTYVVRFDETVNVTDVKQDLAEVYGHAPEVKIYGSDNQVRIVTKYRIDETGAEVDADVETKMYEGLKSILGDGVSKEEFLKEHRQSSLKVGPTIADDIKKSAIWAISLSLLIVFLYIFARFRNWQYGLGALVALIHDTLIVLGLFSLLKDVMPFSLEIDQAFIAAILTVVGYSINDTVVVFDRIREYIGLHPKHERQDIMNSALNSTLGRTFSTSLSTFFVLLVIFLFGGEVIQGFTFALLIGVVVGTYSSLFIATPVSYDTIKVKALQSKKKK